MTSSSLDFNLLRRLCEAAGAPGHEDRIRHIVCEVMRPLVDEISVDAIGNVIGKKRGRGKTKLMVSSHMDEISFMVTHVDDDGFIRFTTLGGFDPKTLTAQRVVVHGQRDLLGVMGSKPVHLMSTEEKKSIPKIEEYFVDVGLPAEEVRAVVSVGDTITRQREMVEVGNTVNGKSFDNRMGVFVMLEAMRRLRRHEVDVYPVASAQEEIGIRGAMVAARNIDPDIGIALDVTLANDVPDAKPHEHVTRLGGGAAIKVMDQSVISHPKMVDFLRRLAQGRGIRHQLEVLPRGGTDTAAIQRGGKGAAVACISIPTRYVHSVIEMCHKQDIEACVQLLSSAIEEAHQEDFQYSVS